MPSQADLFKALADPSRLAIFERLCRAELPVRDLTAQFDISQAAVSQHLAQLKAAGLVTVRKDGRLAYYKVKPAGLKPVLDWLAHYQAFWPERVGRLDALLKRMDA